MLGLRTPPHACTAGKGYSVRPVVNIIGQECTAPCSLQWTVLTAEKSAERMSLPARLAGAQRWRVSTPVQHTPRRGAHALNLHTRIDVETLGLTVVMA